jgi:hypothetical protein
MRIRIESNDIDPAKTRIVCAETGEVIKGVESAKVIVTPNRKRAILSFIIFEFEGDFDLVKQVETEVDLIDPEGGRR